MRWWPFIHSVNHPSHSAVIMHLNSLHRWTFRKYLESVHVHYIRADLVLGEWNGPNCCWTHDAFMQTNFPKRTDMTQAVSSGARFVRIQPKPLSPPVRLHTPPHRQTVRPFEISFGGEVCVLKMGLGKRRFGKLAFHSIIFDGGGTCASQPQRPPASKTISLICSPRTTQYCMVGRY